MWPFSLQKTSHSLLKEKSCTCVLSGILKDIRILRLEITPPFMLVIGCIVRLGCAQSIAMQSNAVEHLVVFLTNETILMYVIG